MSLAEGWKKILFFPKDPSLPRGDFMHVKGGYLLACAAQVAQQLSPLLGASGEVLPIELENSSEPCVLWNILKAVDALHNERSTWKQAVQRQDAQYAFHPERLPGEPQVFRVPVPPTTVFSVGVGDGRDFVSQYQKLGLRGLVLKKVWESP